jgi:hypothetical protein
MFDQVRIAPIYKASGKALNQSQGSIRRPQQQRASVRGDRTPIETSHNFMACDRLEIE